RETLVASLRAEIDSGLPLEIQGEHAGMHVVVTLPPGTRDVEISQRAAGEGIATMPLSICYLGRRRRSGLLLGYGGTSTAQIPEAVRALRRAIEPSLAP